MSRTDQKVRDAIGDRVVIDAREAIFDIRTRTTLADAVQLSRVADLLDALLDRDGERVELADKLARADDVADDLQSDIDKLRDAAADALKSLGEILTKLNAHDCDADENDRYSGAYFAELVGDVIRELGTELPAGWRGQR